MFEESTDNDGLMMAAGQGAAGVADRRRSGGLSRRIEE
jgi:hypothetical protein